MKKDQAIEDIRKARKRISRQYGDDITALLDHYRSLEEKYRTRLVSHKRHHKNFHDSHMKKPVLSD